LADGREEKLKSSYLLSLIALGAALCFLVVLVSLNQKLDLDETEHIHSAWYVKEGFRPYTDFYQHHHPLIWYLAAPLVDVFGECAEIILFFRMVTFGLTLLTAIVVYLTAIEVAKSAEAGLISVLVMLSLPLFVRASVEFRPDVPQVLLGVVSVWLLLRFLGAKHNEYMALSGLSAAFSFLFSQKTIFLLSGYGMIFLWGLARRRMSLRPVLCFCAAFSVPVLAYAVYLLATGCWGDYFLTNWLVNIYRRPTDTFSPFVTIDYGKPNRVFWVSTILAVSVALFRRRANEKVGVVGFLAVVMFASLFFVKIPLKQYFIFPIALLSISIGCLLQGIFDWIRIPKLFRFLSVLAVLYAGARHLATRETTDENFYELQRIQFVLDNTRKGDAVYDGQNSFNLFREDLHYFFYSLRPEWGLETYNKLTGGRYGDYDICELIREKRPKLISDYEFNFETSGLGELYEPTRYNGLYIRRDNTRG